MRSLELGEDTVVLERLRVWIVDDHITNREVIEPILDCIRSFLRIASLSDDPPPEILIKPVKAPGSGFSSSLRFVGRVEFPAEFGQQQGLEVHRRVTLEINAIQDWKEPLSFFDGIAGGTLDWPHLVMTDLFEGTPVTPDSDSGLEELPGFQLANRCVKAGIPVVLFSSDNPTIEDRRSGFMAQGNSNLFYYSRDEIGTKGKVLEALVQHIWPRLQRLLWNDDLEFTVRGHFSEQEQNYSVEFREGGNLVSLNEKVGATPYTYLYIWAHASRLAMWMNWKYSDLTADWAKSACVPVSADIPEKQVVNYRRPNFETNFWKKNKNRIFHQSGLGHGNMRLKNILNANIEYLEPPRHVTLPGFWNHPEVKENIFSVLPLSLPPEGIEWLDNVRKLDR